MAQDNLKPSLFSKFIGLNIGLEVGLNMFQDFVNAANGPATNIPLVAAFSIASLSIGVFVYKASSIGVANLLDSYDNTTAQPSQNSL